MQQTIKHSGRYLYPMYMSLIIFTSTGIQTILEFIEKTFKIDKNKNIFETAVYAILSVVILWIMYGVAQPVFLATIG